MKDIDAQLMMEALREVDHGGTDYKVGDILKSEQTGDDLDGIIVDIYEEDGEIHYALMEVGEEGWSVKASEVKSAPTDPNAPGPAGGRPEDKWHRGRGGYIPGQHD
jgi:hypothetical protein